MEKIRLHSWVALTDDLELMLTMALRYSLGRENCGSTIEYIRYLIPQLSVGTLLVMNNDIVSKVNMAKTLHKVNPECYVELYMADEWEKLSEKIMAEYEKKKAVQT